MELFTTVSHEEFGEELFIKIPCRIKDNKQAYACLCLNELLHTFGIITDDNYAVVYAVLTDSDIFTEF